MSHTYVSCNIHCIFSTKGRRRVIVPDIRERLWAYMGGIARQNETRALAIGGTEDHAHVLLSLPATMTISKAVQLIKGGSSKWIRETLPPPPDFEWQEGYGAFCEGIQSVAEVEEYIRRQYEHHKRRTFEEEFIAFLKAHNQPYDEKHVFG